jgi:hypothetical protein
VNAPLAPTGHSPVGASVMHRILECPLSVSLSDGIEQPSTPYAEEGTMLHELAAMHLLNDPERHLWAPVSEEQAAVVEQYVTTVRAEQEALGPYTQVMVETRFALPGLHPRMFGTADAVVMSSTALRVIDLKCGSGVSVEVEKNGRLNPQLGYYMLGALAAIGWTVTVDKIAPPVGQRWLTDLEIIIVQPRNGGVKRRKVDLVELHDLAIEMVQAIENAYSDAPRSRAGEHCRFCPARPTCPVLRKHIIETALDDFGDMRVPEDMAPDELAEALDLADTVEMWARSIREHAHALLMKGGSIEGWKLVQKRATRKWTDPDAALLHLLDSAKMNPDDVTKQEIKSPAQIEKVLKQAGKSMDELAGFISKESTGTTLARSSDKRPEVSGQKAEDDFND